MKEFRKFIGKPEQEAKKVQAEKITESVKETKIIDEIKEPSLKDILETANEELQKDEVVTEASDLEEFSELSESLSKDDLLEIKKHAMKEVLGEELSVSELIDLVLEMKKGKPVKVKNFDSLLIREYIDRNGKITRNGRNYLETDSVKERIRKLVR